MAITQGFYQVATTSVSFVSVDIPSVPPLTSRNRFQHTPGQHGANFVALDKLPTNFKMTVICRPATTAVTWTESSDKAHDSLESILQRIGRIEINSLITTNVVLNHYDVVGMQKASGASTQILHEMLNLYFTRLI